MRPTNFIDVAGQRFGRWTVLSYYTNKGWLCRCDCGNERIVNKQNLKSGTSKSCGCMADELSSIRGFKHGLTESREYGSWFNMHTRCSNENTDAYKYYGGRGILVCPEWSDFRTFITDMGPSPSKDHSIDRIDNNGDYCKLNCRWATKSEQAYNKRTTIYLNINGKKYNLLEASSLCGIMRMTIVSRLHHGWSDEDAATIPVRSIRQYSTKKGTT